MGDRIKILNSCADYNDYCIKNGISLGKLEENDIIAIPALYNKDYYFAQETVDFIKYCRENDDEHKYDILSDGDIRVRSLHSFDIWMPIVLITQSILLPLAINMVSNYIWDKKKGREKDEAEVDITFIVKKGNKEKSLYYKGSAKGFKESFKMIDLNKMWEE